jgi:hypothetical protein
MPKIYHEEEFPDLTPALGVWALRHNVRPVDFVRAMGWTYTYGYNVITNKKQKFRPAAYGRFILKFGLNSLIELAEIAKVDLNKGGVG